MCRMFKFVPKTASKREFFKRKLNKDITFFFFFFDNNKDITLNKILCHIPHFLKSSLWLDPQVKPYHLKHEKNLVGEDKVWAFSFDQVNAINQDGSSTRRSNYWSYSQAIKTNKFQHFYLNQLQPFFLSFLDSSVCLSPVSLFYY